MSKDRAKNAVLNAAELKTGRKLGFIDILDDIVDAVADVVEDVVDLADDAVELGGDIYDAGVGIYNAVADAFGDDGRKNCKNECADPTTVNKGSKGFRVAMDSPCSLKPVSVYQVIPSGIDKVTELVFKNGGTTPPKTYTGEPCTCASCIYKPGGCPHDDIGKVQQKWCKCAQGGKNLLQDVENYALLGPICPSYPAIGSESYCEIYNGNSTALPKQVICKFEMVVFPGGKFVFAWRFVVLVLLFFFSVVLILLLLWMC